MSPAKLKPLDFFLSRIGLLHFTPSGSIAPDKIAYQARKTRFLHVTGRGCTSRKILRGQRADDELYDVTS